jgi:mercuric ion transport protein
MSNKGCVCTGAVGSVIAAIRCFTPILVIVLGGLGLATWLAYADYVLFPLLFAFLALLAFGLYRQRIAALVGGSASPQQGAKL